MEVQVLNRLHGYKLRLWQAFLQSAGLEPDLEMDTTVLIWEGEQLVAAGSRKGDLLKCIAVDEDFQGLGLTATVLTQLRQDAFAAGFDHLFLYTKPKNLLQFQSLFFYPVAQTQDVLLMENKPDGIGAFLRTLPVAEPADKVGTLVMNCNPFTLGHRYLIETAAKECDRVYVFVLSQEQPPFPAGHRLQLVKDGCQDLPNVTVLPTGPYLISAATFPTYFLKDREQATEVQCHLDMAIFSKYFIPRFHITHRYVGTEPHSPMTAQYNEALKESLPIPVRESPRLEVGGQAISASRVRSLWQDGKLQEAKDLLPPTTYAYLQQFGK